MQHQIEIEELTQSAERYVKTSCTVLKLEAVETSSVIGAGLVSSILIAVMAFLVIFFFSLGMGFYLSYIRGDNYSGFVIIAGFYLILGCILFLGRKKLVEIPVRDKIIRKVFSKN